MEKCVLWGVFLCFFCNANKSVFLTGCRSRSPHTWLLQGTDETTTYTPHTNTHIWGGGAITLNFFRLLNARLMTEYFGGQLMVTFFKVRGVTWSQITDPRRISTTEYVWMSLFFSIPQPIPVPEPPPVPVEVPR